MGLSWWTGSWSGDRLQSPSSAWGMAPRGCRGERCKGLCQGLPQRPVPRSTPAASTAAAPQTSTRIHHGPDLPAPQFGICLIVPRSGAGNQAVLGTRISAQKYSLSITKRFVEFSHLPRSDFWERQRMGCGVLSTGESNWGDSCQKLLLLF